MVEKLNFFRIPSLSWRIYVENLEVTLGGKTIIKAPSLEIGSGEIITLYGKSGSGKTTLALALAGLIPKNGDITLYFGNKRLKLGNKLLKKIVSYLPQEFGDLIDYNETVENFLKKLFPYQYRYKFEEFLETLTLLELNSIVTRKKFGVLSLGERQRVILALILLRRSLIYIFDEPDSALDICTTDKLIKLLKKLTEFKNISCLIITHKGGSMVNYSKKIFKIQNGLVKMFYYGKYN